MYATLSLSALFCLTLFGSLVYGQCSLEPICYLGFVSTYVNELENVV